MGGYLLGRKPLGKVVGLFMLVLIIISPLPSLTVVKADQDAASVDRCPEGLINAVAVFMNITSRLISLAEENNVSIGSDILSRAEKLLSLAPEDLSNKTVSECRSVIDEFSQLIDRLVDMVIEESKAAELIKDRVLLKAAEKLLRKAEALGLMNLSKVIREKIANGTVSDRDIEVWGKIIGRAEIANKSRDIDDIVRRIVEQSIIGPTLDNESKALAAISVAEHVLERVKEILEEAGADSRALEALNQAISNVKSAKRVLEQEKKLDIDEKLMARIDRLANRTQDLISMLNKLPIPNDTVGLVNSSLSRVLEILEEARNSVLAGNISEARRLLEAAFRLYEEASEMAERSMEMIEDLMDEIFDLREELIDLREEVMDIVFRVGANETKTIEEMFSYIESLINQIYRSAVEGNVSEAREMLLTAKIMIKELEALIKQLKERKAEEKKEEYMGRDRDRRGGREDDEAVSELASEIRDARRDLAELIAKLNRFQNMAEALNITDARIKELLEALYGDVNRTLQIIAEAENLLERGNVTQARMLLAQIEVLIEAIENAMDNLEELMEKAREKRIEEDEDRGDSERRGRDRDEDSGEDRGSRARELASEIESKLRDLDRLERYLERLRGAIDNDTIQEIRSMIEEAYSLLEKAREYAEAGNLTEAKLAIERVDAIIDVIEEMIQELSRDRGRESDEDRGGKEGRDDRDEKEGRDSDEDDDSRSGERGRDQDSEGDDRSREIVAKARELKSIAERLGQRVANLSIGANESEKLLQMIAEAFELLEKAIELATNASESDIELASAMIDRAEDIIDKVREYLKQLMDREEDGGKREDDDRGEESGGRDQGRDEDKARDREDSARDDDSRDNKDRGRNGDEGRGDNDRSGEEGSDRDRDDSKSKGDDGDEQGRGRGGDEEGKGRGDEASDNSDSGRDEAGRDEGGGGDDRSGRGDSEENTRGNEDKNSNGDNNGDDGSRDERESDKGSGQRDGDSKNPESDGDRGDNEDSKDDEGEGDDSGGVDNEDDEEDR